MQLIQSILNAIASIVGWSVIIMFAIGIAATGVGYMLEQIGMMIRRHNKTAEEAYRLRWTTEIKNRMAKKDGSQ